MAETIYFKRGPIRVTSTHLRTRFKDEPLLPDQSVIVGRDPLWLALLVACGLLMFSYSFSDLLFAFERVLLIGISALIASLGFGTATLQIGQYMRERTVLVAPIWTINAVRKAIATAKSERNMESVRGAVLDDQVN